MKGQVAFEFLVIYTVFMIAFIATVYVSSNRAVDQQLYAEQVYAQEIGNRFAQEINTAARFHGYEKTYYFSDTVKGSSYEINITGGTMVMFYRDRGVYYYPLMTQDISINGQDTSVTSQGINVTKGFMTLRNLNGKVDIRQ
jgi:hypothetical protein